MKKDWIARELTIEIMVGVFIIMIFLGLGYFTIMLSKESWFGNKHKLEIVFSDVRGLREGDNVVVRGMPVGKVKRMQLKPDGVHVMTVFNAGINPEVREDYHITIVASSILGGRYLLVDEGSPGMPMVSKDVALVGHPPYDLIADASELVNAVRRGLVDGGVIDNFKETSDAIREIAERLRDGKGSLGRLLSEDDKLYNDLASTVASLKNLAKRMENGEGTMGKLFSEDPGLYDDVAATAEALKHISQSIDKGEGSLGLLVKDDALYNEVKGAVEELRAAVDDMRETTPVATFTSIFFGVF